MDGEIDWRLGLSPVFRSERVLIVNGKKILQKHWAEANRQTEISFRQRKLSLELGKIQDEAFELATREGWTYD